MVVFLAVVISVIICIEKANQAVNASDAGRVQIVKNYNRDIGKTAKQKYVTITSLCHLKNRANNFGSADLLITHRFVSVDQLITLKVK